MKRKLFYSFRFLLLTLLSTFNLVGQKNIQIPAKQYAMPNSCGLVVNAGPDITICSNQGKRINANVTGSTNYSWEPADGLSDPNSLNPIANPVNTTTYTLTARATSGNLITNGGFETGNIAPSTSQYTPYTNVNNLITSTGGYMVMSVPQIAMAFGCTPSIGAFTMVITPTGSSTNIWCQTISVNTNTDYKIDYKVFGIPYIFGAPPTIGLKINGTLVGTVDAISGLCLEASGSFTWNSGSNTSATICFANYGGTGPASMCAIDDIVVKECCEEKDEVTVTVYELEAIVNPPDEINCLNRPITIDASASTQGPGITYSWSTRNGKIKSGDKSLTPVVDSPGVYTLKIMGQFGCETEIMVEVKGSVTPPDLSLKNTHLDCQNNTAKIEANSKSAGPSYEWNGPNGYYSTKAINFNIKDAGEYFIKVTDAFGCESTGKVEVLDLRSMMEAEIIGDSLSCNKDSIVLIANSIAFKPDYDWTGPKGFSKDSTEKVVVRDTGWYYLTTRDSAGCKEQDSFYVKSNAGQLSISLKGDTINCLNKSVQLQLKTDSLANIIWIGPNQFQSTDKNPWVNQGGWYYVTVKTADGCMGMDSIFIAQSADVPDIYVSQNDTINCTNRVLQISGNSQSPGAKMEWLTPSGIILRQNNLNIDSAGIYIFRVTGSNGCTVEKSLIISIDTLKPIIRLQSDTINCFVDSIVLTNVAGSVGLYLWSGPGGFTNQNTRPQITTGGVYKLTIIGSNGCIAADSINVIEDKVIPTLFVEGDTIRCNKLQVSPEIQTDSSTVSYLWSGPNGFSSNQKNITVQDPGIYSLMITGINGCTNSRSINIVADTTKPFAMLDADTITCNSTAFLNASRWSGSILNYTWYGPQGFLSSNSNPPVTVGGYYRLVIQGTNGCVFEDSVEVIQKDRIPDLIVKNDTLTCLKSKIILQAQTNTSGVRFEWMGPNGFQSLVQNPEVQDSGWYIIRIIDSLGCENSSRVYVPAFQQSPTFQLIHQKDTLTCTDSLLNIKVAGLQSGEWIKWTGPSGFQSNLDSVNVRWPGWYIITVTNAFGCMHSDSLRFLDNRNLPNIQLFPDTINCIKNRISLNLNAPDPNLSFSWTGPSGFTSSLRNPIISEGGRYQLTATNRSGCQTTQWIDIAMDTLHPDLDLSADTINCLRTLAPVKASSTLQGFIMQWKGPNGFMYSFPQFNTTNTGLYYCTIINPRNGCNTLDSVWVVEDTNRIRGVIFQANSAGCSNPNGNIQILQVIGGKQPFEFSLDNGSHFVQDLQSLSLTPGKYSVLIRDVNGCTYPFQSEILRQDSVSLSPLPDIALNLDQTQQINLNILSDPNKISSILWAPSDLLSCNQCQNPIITALRDATIQVTVTDTNGCQAIVSFQLIILKETKIYFPNVFSPNGDNINDSFYPIEFGNSSHVKFLNIYDRWGNQVFTRENFNTNQSDQGWNGRTPTGEALLPGVYLYIASIRIGDSHQIFSGSITLVD